jgi:hypothetical protein
VPSISRQPRRVGISGILALAVARAGAANVDKMRQRERSLALRDM